MSNYRVHEDLSFCRIDGRPIFLDVQSDRYFRLSGEMERAFTKHIEGVCISPRDTALLVARNILTDALPTNRADQSFEAASRSALELPSPPATYGIRHAVEVFSTTCWTQIQLKTRRLKVILDDTINFRHTKTVVERGIEEPRLLRNAQIFLKARRLVPIETCCLLDSLSLATFLAKRHFQASIVFGVTSDPFSAHCWVQSGDMVMNDTIGNIRAYTVIRVI